MDKRDALEIARIVLQGDTVTHEVPSEHPIRTDAASLGYTYWRIAATNMDTGITFNFYTMRPLDGNGPFINDLIASLKWPRELLENLCVEVATDGMTVYHDGVETDRTPLKTTPIYSPFSTEPVHDFGIHNARLIADKQKSGGRPKLDGYSDETKELYLWMADWYYTACKSNPRLSQREFVRQANDDRITVRTLQRACKYYKEVKKNRP